MDDALMKPGVRAATGPETTKINEIRDASSFSPNHRQTSGLPRPILALNPEVLPEPNFGSGAWFRVFLGVETGVSLPKSHRRRWGAKPPTCADGFWGGERPFQPPKRTSVGDSAENDFP